MPALVTVIALLLLPLGPWGQPSQASGKPAFPRKPGIYAMTPQGPVELKVSGERNEVEMAGLLKSYYPPDSFDRIPVAESVRSFYVSAMGWKPRGVYLVVGREYLTNAFEKYQRLNGRVVMRGAVAFEIQSADLESPDFVLRTIRRLAPTGLSDADIEAFLVLELRSEAGLAGRTYPVKIRIPER